MQKPSVFRELRRECDTVICSDCRFYDLCSAKIAPRSPQDWTYHDIERLEGRYGRDGNKRQD